MGETGKCVRANRLCHALIETSSLLVESEFSVVGNNCRVDGRVRCLVGDNSVLVAEIFLADQRKPLVDPTS